MPKTEVSRSLWPVIHALAHSAKNSTRRHQGVNEIHNFLLNLFLFCFICVTRELKIVSKNTFYSRDIMNRKMFEEGGRGVLPTTGTKNTNKTVTVVKKKLVVFI